MPKPWNIGLWGPASAGKTAFLAQLYRRSILFKSDWEIFPTAEADQFLEMVGAEMNQGRFPKATADTEDIAKVAYLFKHRTDGAEASLVIEDRPGLHSKNLSDEGKVRFNSNDALILLFDPDEEQQTLEADIEQTLRRLAVAAKRGTNKDGRPIAICLTKADQLIRTSRDLRRAQETPRQFVLEKVPPQIEPLFAKHCTKYEFFPISSVGLSVRHGVVEQSVFRDERLNLRLGTGGVPLNLMAPISWLFDQMRGGPQ